MIIYRTFRDKDCVIEFDYKVTNGGCSAQTYGPPENCYPAEPMEYEITTIYSVRDDVLGETRPELVLTEAERAEIMEWLETSDTVYEKISEHESDYNDDYGD
jgi:hypothetical protein